MGSANYNPIASNGHLRETGALADSAAGGWPDWQPMDSAPHDGTPVLAWDLLNEEATIAVHLSGAEGWNGWYPLGDLSEPATLSHWMPLPPRP